MCFTKMQAAAQDHVEEIVVLVEAKTENAGVDVLEVFEGVEALKEGLLDLQDLGKCYRGWVGKDGHDPHCRCW